jgi:hypothetical protein
MKKILFTFSLFLVSSLLLPPPVPAHVSGTPGRPLAPSGSVWARGAANPNELARTVLQAIQENNADGLNAFLLSDTEFTQLKSKGSADMKAFLQNTSVTDLQSTFRKNYDELIKTGISQTINWSELEVSEARLGKAAARTPYLLPVTIILSDKQHKPLTLILDTIKINNRYYLFRTIELQPRQ